MTDDELLARFAKNAPDFQAFLPELTAEERHSFCEIVRLVHIEGLDWYFTGKKNEYFRFGRKNNGNNTATHRGALGFFGKKDKGIRFWFNPSIELNLGDDVQFHEFALNGTAVNIAKRVLEMNQDDIAGRLKTDRNGLWPDDYPHLPKKKNRAVLQDTMPENEDIMPADSSSETVNLILYGPPGTGKTYATAAKAVRLCGETVPEGRKELMVAYHRLIRAGRIEFVTFHQSLAYEDFVEGLRPQQGIAGSGTDGEQPAAGFTLVPKDGIFRRIVREALGETEEKEDTFSLAGKRVFKLSMGVAGDHDDAHIFKNAIRDGYAIIGYGEVDFTDPRFASPDAILKAVQDSGVVGDKVLTSASGWVKMPNIFRNQMRIDDIIVVSRGNGLFRAIGQITGDYYFEPLEERPDYAHRRKVRWLWVSPESEPVDRIYAKDFSMATVYQLKRDLINVPALAQYIGRQHDTSPVTPQPYVLIIDEINRANISKVFGELITLLEPDKRLGQPNELQVRLPYSGDLFGVPSNLHIIGTMNTADRSIALLDTALRRRFDFRELMPDPTQLETVDGIDLPAVLRALNERIEYLFDREHQIGHAYFIKCMARQGSNGIDQVMRDRIIPLLAEYFYEDWDKVAAVLGDATETEGDYEGGFLNREKLPVPRGLGLEAEGSARYRWRVRTQQEGFDYNRGLLDV